MPGEVARILGLVAQDPGGCCSVQNKTAVEGDVGRRGSPIDAAEAGSRPQPVSAQVERATDRWRDLSGAVGSAPPLPTGTTTNQRASDPVTGLATRPTLLRRVADEIVSRVRSSSNGARAFAVVLINLDRSTEVNDVLGPQVGTPFLAEFGRRLATGVPVDAVAARLSGDQFAVLLPHAHTPSVARTQATAIAAATAGPVYVGEMILEVATSSGIAMYPRHGVDAEGLLQRANIAAGRALSGGTTAMYAPDSAQYDPDQLRLVSDLRRALDRSIDHDDGGIDVHYQPQIAVATGELVGVEALLRWNRAGHGVVDTRRVIRAVEHTTVMRLLTDHVLGKVTAQLADWSRAGLRLRASVNVSARDLHAASFADHVIDQLAAWHVDPTQLQLEVTESALLDDTRQIRDTVRQLGSAGVALSLDDFGTGYASLLRLRRLPLAEIKIDRSFVSGMATDGSDIAIVRSIIDLGRACGLRVVAEGVEDELTHHHLAVHGCHVAQGWYHGYPMSAGETTSWIARHQYRG